MFLQTASKTFQICTAATGNARSRRIIQEVYLSTATYLYCVDKYTTKYDHRCGEDKH